MKKKYSGLIAAAVGVVSLLASAVVAGKLLDPDRKKDGICDEDVDDTFAEEGIKEMAADTLTNAAENLEEAAESCEEIAAEASNEAAEIKEKIAEEVQDEAKSFSEVVDEIEAAVDEKISEASETAE